MQAVELHMMENVKMTSVVFYILFPQCIFLHLYHSHMDLGCVLIFFVSSLSNPMLCLFHWCVCVQFYIPRRVLMYYQAVVVETDVSFMRLGQPQHVGYHKIICDIVPPWAQLYFYLHLSWGNVMYHLFHSGPRNTFLINTCFRLNGQF